MDPLTMALLIAFAWGAARGIDAATDGWFSAEVGGGTRGAGRYVRSAGARRWRQAQAASRAERMKTPLGRFVQMILDELGALGKGLLRGWRQGRRSAQQERRQRRGGAPLPWRQWGRRAGIWAGGHTDGASVRECTWTVSPFGLSLFGLQVPCRLPAADGSPFCDEHTAESARTPCVRCGQPLGSNPDCSECMAVAGHRPTTDQGTPDPEVEVLDPPEAGPRTGPPEDIIDAEVVEEPGPDAGPEPGPRTGPDQPTDQPAPKPAALPRAEAILVVAKSSTHCSRCLCHAMTEWKDCQSCGATFVGIMSVYPEYAAAVAAYRPDLPMVDKAPPPESDLTAATPLPASWTVNRDGCLEVLAWRRQEGREGNWPVYCGRPCEGDWILCPAHLKARRDQPNTTDEDLEEYQRRPAPDSQAPEQTTTEEEDAPPGESAGSTPASTPNSTEGASHVPDINNAPAAIGTWEAVRQPSEGIGSAIDNLAKQCATLADGMGDFEIGGEPDVSMGGRQTSGTYSQAREVLDAYIRRLHACYDASIGAADGHQPSAHSPMQPA